MNKSARQIALSSLIKVLKNKAYSNLTLNQAFQKEKLSEKDKHLATRIVYGTIQHKLFLDYQVKHLLKSKVKDDYLVPLLWMSIYQLEFMDKIPERAVLDEANKLSKQFGKKSQAFRLVNGVLRNYLRTGAVLPDPENQVAFLSVKYSFPEWLVQYFIKNFGDKSAEKMLASYNEVAKNSVRIVRKNGFAELAKAGFEPEESALLRDVVLVKHGGVVNTDAFKNGDVTIQDEASAMVVKAFDFKGDEQVLDACAAPGGKTMQIAESLTSGQVSAMDLHGKKLNLIKENAKRLGVAEKVKTIQGDARKDNDAISTSFDKILVDAPCSGLGLLRRKPEIRYEKTYEDIQNLAKIQAAILEKVVTYLKAGGELVYSTCSISVEENEQVIKEFVKAHPEMELVKFQCGKLVAEKGMLKILPQQYGSDGFFIAKMQKK
ncbi:MAG: 16S rRNA (cytosine(967)-C(5))-methyltransferase RsmB [Lactobacillus sp.]|nr:16S rRNA (cytosine(967)-C(5))-methyltransferase RsmB [Lactobacillus sp.]